MLRRIHTESSSLPCSHLGIGSFAGACAVNGRDPRESWAALLTSLGEYGLGFPAFDSESFELELNGRAEDTLFLNFLPKPFSVFWRRTAQK